MLDLLTTSELWESALQAAAPIGFAALAALVCARAGVLFVAVEGSMLVATFAAIAATAWTGSVVLGVIAGLLGGVAVSLLSGVMSIAMRMGDIVAGIVIHVTAIGVMGFLSAELFPGGQTTGGKDVPAPLPETGIPVLDILTQQSILIYLLPIAAVAFHMFLRTRRGLILRSSGESLDAARSYGIDVVRVRYQALAAAGVLVGIGGAVLGLSIVGTFDPGVVGGRGFIGLACMIVGAWLPLTTVLAAGGFGLAFAYAFQTTNQTVAGWMNVVPYVLTLIAIGALWGRAAGPQMLGMGVRDEVMARKED